MLTVFNQRRNLIVIFLGIWVVNYIMSILLLSFLAPERDVPTVRPKWMGWGTEYGENVFYWNIRSCKPSGEEVGTDLVCIMMDGICLGTSMCAQH